MSIFFQLIGFHLDFSFLKTLKVEKLKVWMAFGDFASLQHSIRISDFEKNGSIMGSSMSQPMQARSCQCPCLPVTMTSRSGVEFRDQNQMTTYFESQTILSAHCNSTFGYIINIASICHSFSNDCTKNLLLDLDYLQHK